ncbi:MAG TPA: hypothetical protein VGZ47_17665 [Gemmataceae bacterium]|nr:hypothetical protein [Gemmataceae bacterium]
MRRKFAHEWDEIIYLFRRILYWFHDVQDRKRALRYRKRFRALLEKAASAHEAIFGEECWSLLSELEGDLDAAIKYRENEIRLVRSFWKLLEKEPLSPDIEESVMKGYHPIDLSHRMILLAILYDDAGRRDDAVRALQESKKLCRERRIPFHGAEILKELTEDRRERVHRLEPYPTSRTA